MIWNNLFGTENVKDQMKNLITEIKDTFSTQNIQNQIGNIVTSMADDQFDANKIVEYVDSLKNLDEQQKITIISTSALSQEHKDQVKDIISNKAATEAETVAKTTNTVATKAQTVAQSGLNTALSIGGKLLKQFAIGAAIAVAIKLIEVFVKEIDEMIVTEQEAIELHEKSVQKAKDSIAEYEKLADELESINDKYDDNKEKLKELYKLRENNSITDEEKEYLEQLESENEKLKKQIEYKQSLADIEAKEAEDDAVASLNEKTQSGNYVVNGKTKTEEITDAEKIKLNTSTIKGLTQQLKDYETVISGVDLPADRVDVYTKSLNALNEKLQKTGSLSEQELESKTLYEALLNGSLTYEQYEKAVEKNSGRVEELVTENNTLLQTVEPLTDAIVSTTGENYELKKSNEAIIAGAKDAAIGFNEYTKSLNGTSEALNNFTDNSSKSFLDILNSADYADIKENLLELAKSGEISPETLSSTEEYNKLLEETGVSAEDATNQILDMLTAQERLAGVSQGLGKLTTAYDEFKDIGFVTAETLTSLPDVFKNLPQYDLFSQIVGDPTSGATAIQKAFDDICKSYLFSQDILQGLVNANESEIQSYIANLKHIGITNAEEIVKQAIDVLNAENELINAAGEEYFEAYCKYLESKDEADLEYLENAASKNGQLANALGSAYQTDYNNWCELLSSKAEAYNEFVTAIGDSYDESMSVVENMIANGQNMGFNNIAHMYELEAEYDRRKREAEKFKDTIKLDLSTITTDFSTSFSPSSKTGDSAKDSEETADEFKKTFDFVETLLGKISKKTEKLLNKIDKFVDWQKKNSMINRAIQSTNNEINQNNNAYQYYMNKANSVGLSRSYIKKIQDGTLNIQDITDEALADKIDKYKEWYDKAENVLDTIEELYDKERELIRQKLDNVLDYYNDMDSYLSSITSKVESLISLNDAMGKRSSLAELVEQFAKANEQLDKTVEIDGTRTEIDFGESDAVNQAKKEANKELINSLRAEIDNLDASQSGTYTKLLKNIANTEAQIQKYEDKGWDVTKASQYEKLQQKLSDYYDLQTELDENATSNTITNYSKVYTAFQKLQNKINNGKDLTKNEQKKYDSYLAQMEEMRNSKDDIIAELEAEIGKLNGTVADTTDEQKARQAIAKVQEDLENSATYKNLLKTISDTEDKITALDEKGYDNLTSSQKKTYDKLSQQLEDYYEKKEAFDKDATADNIAQYNEIYNAWRKLQDKLDADKNLSTDEWKKYNNYVKQLEDFANSKNSLMASLEKDLDKILNPGDKLDVIEREYEESAKGIYDSYQKQIDGIKNAVTETKQYQNILAEAQKLEQKKDTKGLSESEQAKLDKYNAKLEALREGGTASNVADYIATWDKWYALEEKIKKNGTLSSSDAKKYDEYTAKLKEWNKEKQTQVNDLVSLMEDELESLQKTYVENVANAESEISEHYSSLYELAKQIAEYNLSTLETQLSLLDSYISYYKEIISLYDSFSGDKLNGILTDLDIGLEESQESLYEKYLSKLEEKYDATLSKINEYNELINAIDTNDFAGSMQLFQGAIEEYKSNGQTDMAEKLQSVLDLLDERSVNADDWDEFADEWLIEWEKALSEAKTELIDTATSIQEINDALREISFSNITNAIKELSNAQDVLSAVSDLINDDWLYDKDGNLTQYGLTKVGLLVEEMENARAEASKYAQLMESIQSARDTYASDEAYQDALQEAKMNYFSALSNVQGYQDSIVSIITKADEAIINSLKEVIKKRKEALQKKKELYEYDKSIKTSQKEIDSIKAQIDALESLSDATDSATKAKLAQLKADLLEKEEELQETKDEHTYNLQIDALDEFMENLDSTMKGVSESVNSSFESYVEAINEALKLYEENREYLNGWSNSVIDTVAGLGENISANLVGDDLNIKSKESDVDAGYISPSVNVVNSDTVSTIEDVGEKTNENLISIYDILQDVSENGVLAQIANSPILTINPEMMSYLQNNIPSIATSVNHTIPEIIKERNDSPVINIHYDTLMRVDGNVDRDFAQLLPDYLRKSCEYTKANIYAELQRLR